LVKYAGKRIEINIEKSQKKRSSFQNRYYWGVIVAMLADHTGYTKEEMHEILKYNS